MLKRSGARNAFTSAPSWSRPDRKSLAKKLSVRSGLPKELYVYSHTIFNSVFKSSLKWYQWRYSYRCNGSHNHGFCPFVKARSAPIIVTIQSWNIYVHLCMQRTCQVLGSKTKFLHESKDRIFGFLIFAAFRWKVLSQRFISWGPSIVVRDDTVKSLYEMEFKCMLWKEIQLGQL